MLGSALVTAGGIFAAAAIGSVARSLLRNLLPRSSGDAVDREALRRRVASRVVFAGWGIGMMLWGAALVAGDF